MLVPVEDGIRKYLAEIGRRGGKRSRRTLSSEAARDMVRVREARRAFRTFHAQCFWSSDPNYRVRQEDIPWVVQGLSEHGGRRGLEVARALVEQTADSGH